MEELEVLQHQEPYQGAEINIKYADTEISNNEDCIRIKAPEIIQEKESEGMTTYTDILLERASEKAKSLLSETLKQFQKEGFTQYEVDDYLHLLSQAVKDSNGFSAFQSYFQNVT